MTGNITNFRIDALYGRRTIDIPIKDNMLILVGENGTGKSTVSNLIYLFLTCQWRRMLRYDFLSVSAVIDGGEININRSDISGNNTRKSSRLRSLQIPKNLIKQIESIASRYSLDSISSDPESLVNDLINAGIPHNLAFEYVFLINEEIPPISLQKFASTDDIINASITSQVLYLPTYRRIEQDLKDILHEYNIPSLKHISRQNEFIQKSLFEEKGLISNHIELVKFGMEDVEIMFDHTMNSLKDIVRNDLSNLTGRYLRDVIQKAYHKPEIKKITELNKETIDAIFNRIDKSILTRTEQKTLRDIISKIKKDNTISDEDRVIVHFLTQLIDLYKIQQGKEKDVRDFVDVCNKYLNGKELFYDNINFQIHVKQEHSRTSKYNNIDIKMLSSGEKQIVSLFAHIYLSGEKGYFVIIDEPELSLSVPWQKKFLPDILNTNKCNGLIAVTHSPFIFDNKLDSYTHSLEEFVG